MSDMENTIEQVRQAMQDAMNTYGPFSGTGQAQHVYDYLHALGLLAPAPLREEWATRFPNGHLRPGRDRDYNMWFKGDPPKGVNVHRCVTDWVES